MDQWGAAVKRTISQDVVQNVKDLKKAMNNSFDLISKSIALPGKDAAIIYVNDLVNEEAIDEQILKPLTDLNHLYFGKQIELTLELIQKQVITTGDVKTAVTFDEIIGGVFTGYTFLCVQDLDKGLLIYTGQYAGRNVEDSVLEPSVKGPQEAFTETLIDNLGLIRKRLRAPGLTFDYDIVGKRSRTYVVVGYIKGIARNEVVNEALKRIKRIDTDGTGSAQVQKFINDNPKTIFPLVQVTERPDKVVSSLLEGRVVIIVEGTPRAYLVPVTLTMLLQSIDDYYENWLAATSIRLMRYLALFISSVLPALYIALTSFHPGLLPTTLALSIAGTRMGVPFPAFIEAVLMVGTLELLQEAGIRLPRVVGQTVSIVGGLVIGQAAVQAGIVSPIMVIVISITAISSFAIPDFSLGLATRLIRFPLMFLATTFGAYGIMIGLLFILAYICSLKSYGVRYLESVTPYNPKSNNDSIVKIPQTDSETRPEFLSPNNPQRQGSNDGGKEGGADKG